MKKLRLAVIGLHFGKTHAVNLREGNARGGELAALVDLNESHAGMAASWGVPFFTDYREMLSKIKPEGVIIATPPRTHLSIAVDCMEAGAHIYLEKPVAVSSEEADELIAAEKRLNKKIHVGFHNRFDPTVIMAREKIASGDLGRLIGFQIFGALPKPEGYFAPEYRRQRKAGGGVVSINGTHDLDKIRFLCGEVDTVFALKASVIRGFDEIEDTAAVSIRCKNGALGTLYVSDCSHPASEFTDTYFLEKGTIRLKCSSFFRQAGFHVYEESSFGEAGLDPTVPERIKNIKTVNIPYQNPHARAVEFFCSMVLDNLEPRTTTADGKKSMELMNAVIESMDTGKIVYLYTP